MSPQRQLDFDKHKVSYYGEDVTSAGCDGGFILTSYRELAWEHGTLENQCQPFTGRQQSKCNNDCTTTAANSQVYKKWSNGTNFYRPINFWVYDYDADVDYRSVGKANKEYNSNSNAQYVWPLVKPSHIEDVFKEIIYNCGPSSVTFYACDSLSYYYSGSVENIYMH
ncbi:MAG: hypothetical protein EZS28_024069 [Streblomastix strix]|uniref:Peptidase C1A papain C-terminal domain-containing protein n=1 Tax=Streblomastix strix TaxID=222440 RepID=A0A5J4VCW1_9EUKA|nr:MAG: hypothetical protein EZS28_024069 [Streblomastix strix]